MADGSFPRNPYVIGVPLTGDVGFYGRRGVFTFVEDTLEAEHQNVIVLYGQRRVGKTSLLHQLVRRVGGDVLPVYFDLQGKEQQSLGHVLYSLARAVVRALKVKDLDQAPFDNAGRFFREQFLPSVYEQLGNRRLLLLFDEFDVLGDELLSPEAASETLFPYLQNLIMHERQIAFVFVVGRRIEELATHFQAIFKQAAYRRVGLLRPEDARALILEPIKGVLTFDEGAIHATLDLTAGHPYFAQLICSEVFNAMKARNQRVVTEDDVLNLVDQGIESGHGALTWFWDGLPRAERFIMSAVAHVTDETGLASKESIRQILEKHRIVLTGLELTDAPDRLVEWEMLRREGPDHYRFVVELVRRWIIRVHPLESARRDVDYISQRAVRLYENARDAHTAGDLEYASGEYRRALDANPNHSGAQLGLAQVLFELGQIEEAIEEFTKAYALDEMSARDGLVRAHLAQGKRLEEAGQQNEAILQYEQALHISPTDATTRRRLATIWLGRGHEALASKGLEAVFEAYEKALDYDSGNTIVRGIKFELEEYTERAEKGRDYEQALKAIRQLRELLPEDGAVLTMEIALWTRRGDALAKDGEGAEAIRAYQQALELKPSDAALTAKLEAVSAEWEELLETDRLFSNAMAAHQDKDWPSAEQGWLELIKMDVLTYKGHNIATFLAEASESSERLRQEQRALFEKGLEAHESQSWPAAGAAWQQLIDQGVETYDGQEIGSLLAEARAKHLQGEKREVKVTTAGTTAAGVAALLGKRGIKRAIWVIGAVVIVLIVVAIGFDVIQASRSAEATAQAEVAASATAQAVLPSPVSANLSNARVVYHDDFDRLVPDMWDFDSGTVKASNGLIEITGKASWTHFYRKVSLHPGEGVLILFKYDADAEFVLLLETGEWETSDFKRWGISGSGEYGVSSNVYEGTSMTEYPLISAGPETWYYLWLASAKGSKFVIQIWERDAPEKKGEYKQVFGEAWADLPWQFGIQCNAGKMYVDTFTHIAFSDIR